MEAWNIARSLLPENLARAMEQYPGAEEIRLRRGKQPGVVIAGRELPLSSDTLNQEALMHVLERATGASMHAAAHALRGGYVTYRGLRIGVCGEGVYSGESLNGLRAFSSLAIRIPRQCPGDCVSLLEKLLCPSPSSVLVVSPPGVGKTSLLRELIRRAAAHSLRLAVIDERNELSASVSGQAQFDLGRTSDVMVGVSKEQAAMMLLRGMNPQIIAMDEITREEDLRAVEQIAGCGVLIFATAHARDREDMKRRPLYRRLLARGIFQELVTIRCLGEKRIYSLESLSP